MSGGLIEVELDDEPGPAPRVRRPRRRWSLRRWGWVAAGLAVALVAVTGLAGADAARRSGRGGVPGFASDLEVPRHELWHEDGAVAVAVTDGLVLVETPGGDGIRAVRAADGTTAWSADGDYCSVVPLDGRARWFAAAGGTRPVAPEDLRVGCVHYGSADQGAVLLDATGTVLARLDATDVQQVGTRLVEVRPDEAATPGTTIRAWSAVDGAPLWERHYDGVDATLGYAVSDTELTLPAREGYVAIDVATGESHPQASSMSELTVVTEVADGTLTSTIGQQGLAVALAGVDGRPRWTYAGAAYLGTAISAPGADDVLLAASGSGAIVALDAGTGDTLWTSPEDALRVLVHVPGIAVVGGAPGVVRDDRTGETLWTVPAGERATATSDRELLLLESPETNELVVRDLRTGHEVLRYPAPDTVYGDPSRLGIWGVLQGVVPLADGVLVMGTAGGVAALGP